MTRCRGPGVWENAVDLESENWEELEEDVSQEDEMVKRDSASGLDDEDEVDSERTEDLKCSPITVIYGHAAGRGLDIKPFSKGIDTGCVVSRICITRDMS
jgi:hypothetical protein